jgi:hypothetical protein
VRQGEELDDGVARGGQEPLGVGGVGARLERGGDRLQQREEDERDEDRQQGQDGARLLPEQPGPEERQVPHGVRL